LLLVYPTTFFEQSCMDFSYIFRPETDTCYFSTYQNKESGHVMDINGRKFCKSYVIIIVSCV
jgi:hypothetical protein